jgi:hypothetical protein
MSDIDNGLIGDVLNALPIDKMISGPLQAMVQAQIQASYSYANFLMQVCVNDGKAVAVQFEYDETLVDGEGKSQGVVSKTMRIPLIAALTHPNICIEEGTIDFDLEITQSFESAKETEGEGEGQGSIGWGPFKVSMKGRASHKSSETRKTDTRAKYSIHTKIKRLDPPEALMRVIDTITNAMAKPMEVDDNEKLLSDDDVKKVIEDKKTESVNAQNELANINTEVADHKDK